MDALVLSFAVVFVAELGDKSQLMAMAFATRYRFWPVLAGIAVATAALQLISVTVGGLIGASLPRDVISVAAGVAFLGFGLWTLLGDDADDDEAAAAAAGRSAFLTVAAAFFVAELGDKTMLATVTLATTEGWLGTWIGATLGMVTADVLAIGVGRLLGRNLPRHLLRIGAAVLFFLFGAWLIVEGLTAA